MTTGAISSQRPAYRHGPLAKVCGEVAAVYKRSWGRGPVEVAAHWAGPDILLVILHNGNTDAEKTLRAAGCLEELLRGRRLLEVLIEDDLKASIERVVGRRVDTVLSATRLDPDMSAQVFLLGAPLPAEQVGAPVPAEGHEATADG